MNIPRSLSKPSTTATSGSDRGEFRHFGFISKLQPKASQVKLLSKINNRDHRLSLVFSTNDNQLYALGLNDAGCLGLGSPLPTIRTPTPIKQLCGKPLLKISSGYQYVIVLTDDGRCYSWGDNRFGQLGLPKTVLNSNKPVFVDCLKNERVVDVCCGYSHALVLTVNYDLFAFGSNVSGTIGNGTTFHQYRAFKLTNLAETAPQSSLSSDIVSMSVGGWHSACVNRKGELFMWGWNQDGQCCQESRTNQIVPTRVLIDNLHANFPCSYSVIKSVQCGLQHTLVLTFDGVVFAFGSNEFGECGQDVALVKMCTTPALVFFEEPMNDICAFAKSRISMARNERHIYYWGQCNVFSKQPHLVQKIAISQQMNYDQSFNIVLGKHELNQFNLDIHARDSPFPPALMISTTKSVPRSNGTLNRTFNDPNESDMVIVFTDAQGVPPSNVSNHMIFVQKTLLDNYDNFLKNFPQQYLTSSSDDSNQENSPSSEKIPKLSNEPDSMLTQMTLTVAKNKKKYYQLSVRGLSYESLYAYLFFTYSNYLSIDEDRLVDVMQLSQLLSNTSLLESCFQYISVHYNLEKFCVLFEWAIEKDMTKVMQFCEEHVRSKIIDPSVDSYSLTEVLYHQRKSAKFALACISADGTEVAVPVHRLIIRVQSQLYESLTKSNKTEFVRSPILDQIVARNEVTTMELLLRAQRVHFDRHFDEEALRLYVQFVYCGTKLSDELPMSVLVSLLKMMNVLNESQLEAECKQRIRHKITLDNVCQFFGQYGHSADNPFVGELCMEVASASVFELLISDDYRRLIAEPDGRNLQAFSLALSNHCLKYGNNQN